MSEPIIPHFYRHYREYDLLVDSRQLLDPARTVFFALAGNRTDGHAFVPELYSRGVRHFVVTRAVGDCPEARFWEVADVLRFLQQLTKHHRQQFDIPVVGITGSNGKTIVKEWAFELLAEHFTTVRSPRSYNSQIGLPLSVWQLRSDHELGIFEAGISQRGEMRRLADILQPTIGLFTNLGDAHRQGFNSQEEKLAEKLQLFETAEVVIFCYDQAVVRQALQGFPGRLFRWSIAHPEVDVYVHRVQREQSGTHCYFRYAGEEYAFFGRFTDANSLENVLQVLSLALYLGVPPEACARRLETLEPLGLRLEVRAGRDGSTLIDDSYSNDLTSLATGLAFLDQQPAAGHTLILSDLVEAGLPGEVLYRQVAGLIGRRINRLIGVGTEVGALQHELSPAIEQQYFRSTEELLEVVDDLPVDRQALLIKGARAFGMERVSARLAARLHRTELEVNLAALTHNLNYFQKVLHPPAELCVLLKASAYGSGSLAVARHLADRPIAYLIVAYPDEGIELRRGGIRAPIMVLNAPPASFDALLRHQLEPEIYSWEQLRALADYVGNRGTCLVHLKVNTGMHRLGFEPEEATAVARYLEGQPQLRVATVFTHLAASEDPAEDAFTHRQIEQFNRAYQSLTAVLGYQPRRHVLNSSGIVRFPQYHFELVRLGLGLYGIESSGNSHRQLQAVLRLQARVSQVRTLPPGATVGYGRAGRLPEGGRIAVLSIGYADGLPRAAGLGRFSVQIRGQAAPIIGQVCMDMCMIDISHIPDVQVGDNALIFGAEWPVERLAQAAGTIVYEIFTNLSERVHRVYKFD